MPRKAKFTADVKIKACEDFINSINLKEELNENYKGWSYLISIEDTNNQSYSIEIYGDKLSFNNIFYSIDPSVSENIEKLYNKFNYPEIDSFN